MWDTPTLHLQCVSWRLTPISWCRHQMEIFSALLAICAGNSPVPGEFPAQRPVTRSFDVFFDLRPNKRLSKQSWGWWFETLSHPLWRHCNVIVVDAKHLVARPSVAVDLVIGSFFHWRRVSTYCAISERKKPMNCKFTFHTNQLKISG